ncbi:MAG TPA: GAF domain-containing protein [Acidimicrobiales bacterium]|nr:GAF domain-containing protein [Acidimicrobiales bacterium]
MTVERLAELTARLGRAGDLDALVSCALAGLDTIFGYEHSMLLLLDADGERLFTIGSRGYDQQGVGSEVRTGEGIVGMCALRATPMRIGNLRQMLRYSRTIRTELEATGVTTDREVPLPGLADAGSQLAVPAMVLGQLVGVVAVESERPIAFSDDDEALLSVIASIVGAAVEVDNERERTADAAPLAAAPVSSATRTTKVRFFAVDGSTFLDGDYLIKGVAGRLLWALLNHHERDGRTTFTNRELRLDPSLELPELRDNFESRLILLKRRLDEREAPVRIVKTGRGAFRLDVETALQLDAA